jgi:hypothetical protein
MGTAALDLDQTFTVNIHDAVPGCPTRSTPIFRNDASRMSLPHPGRTPSPIVLDRPPFRIPGPLLDSERTCQSASRYMPPTPSTRADVGAPQYRASAARIWSAVLIQTWGRGSSFQVLIQSRMSFSSALTLVWAPCLIFLVVRSANHRSTMLSHEPEVGIKCR